MGSKKGFSSVVIFFISNLNQKLFKLGEQTKINKILLSL